VRFILAALVIACSSSPPPKPVPIIPHVEPDKDGDGIPDSKDNCPDFPGPGQHKGCPWCDTMVDWVICTWDGKPDPHCPKGTADDPDADGIPNDKDKCPSVPEDKDGFEDDDGCPEIDNDQDCVFDEVDKCPGEPGPKETNGCPASISSP
jgi:OmpA-OmpF porin, OOP family